MLAEQSDCAVAVDLFQILYGLHLPKNGTVKWKAWRSTSNLLDLNKGNHSFTITYSLTAKSLGHHRWFHYLFPPFFFVLHCPLWLGELQACPFPDVVFPPPFHCDLQDGFGQIWRTGDMLPVQGNHNCWDICVSERKITSALKRHESQSELIWWLSQREYDVIMHDAMNTLCEDADMEMLPNIFPLSAVLSYRQRRTLSNTKPRCRAPSY